MNLFCSDRAVIPIVCVHVNIANDCEAHTWSQQTDGETCEIFLLLSHPDVPLKHGDISACQSNLQECCRFWQSPLIRPLNEKTSFPPCCLNTAIFQPSRTEAIGLELKNHGFKNAPKRESSSLASQTKWERFNQQLYIFSSRLPPCPSAQQLTCISVRWNLSLRRGSAAAGNTYTHTCTHTSHSSLFLFIFHADSTSSASLSICHPLLTAGKKTRLPPCSLLSFYASLPAEQVTHVVIWDVDVCIVTIKPWIRAVIMLRQQDCCFRQHRSCLFLLQYLPLSSQAP